MNKTHHLIKPIAPIDVTNAIRRKLDGKTLTEAEMFRIVKAIVDEEIDPILTTYFVAAGYSKGFSSSESISFTKSLVETGERVSFPPPVVDIHSTGGLCGNKTSLIVVPLLIAAGMTVPKTSSKAITSPSGTADVMELFAQIEFPPEEIRAIVRDVGGCVVWPGEQYFVPADAKIIQVEQPLLASSYQIVLSSILAKKIAFSVTTLLVDLPFGSGQKIGTLKEAKKLADGLVKMGAQFGIHVLCELLKDPSSVGRGVGPVLEARDVLSVLLQKDERPLDLEEKAIKQAVILLQSVKKMPDARDYIRTLLTTGVAWKKMEEMIIRQGGTRQTSTHLTVAPHLTRFYSDISGEVHKIHNNLLSYAARMAGAPGDKRAGIFLERKEKERVEKGEEIFRIYSSSRQKLDLVKKWIETQKVVEVLT